MDEAFQNELQAMQEVGRHRSRTRTLVFGVAWIGVAVLAFALRYGGVRIGLLYCAIIAAPIAAAIAVGVTKQLTPGYITRAAKKYGISEDKLRSDKYLID